MDWNEGSNTINRCSSGVACVSCPGLPCFKGKKPAPEQINHEVTFGLAKDNEIGDTTKAMNPPKKIADNYFWMRDESRRNKQVLKHLKRENAYTDFKTKHIKKSTAKIYKELLDYTTEDDKSVPFPYKSYSYYTRTIKGKGYDVHYRSSINNPREEILLDENELAGRNKYCDVGMTSISPCESIFAYSVDFSGTETYEIRFFDLLSQTHLTETIADTNGTFVWSKYADIVYYTTMDETHRSHKVWSHYIRTAPDTDDLCIYEEKDPKFSLSVSRSRSERFIFIESFSRTAREQRYIDQLGSDDTIHLVSERREDVVYKTYHGKDDDMFVLTNDESAKNFEIWTFKVGNVDMPWKIFLKHDENRSMEYLSCFAEFIVVYGRENGLPSIWILPDYDNKKMFKLNPFENLSYIQVGTNKEYRTDKLRYIFSSPLTPFQTWEYDLKTKEQVLLKQKTVPNYYREDYDTKQIFATAVDGTRIPISLVWNKKTALSDKPGFLHLYGYGSYQISMDLYFRKTILPIINRGVVFAIAHVRGGGEFGREWYEQAKFEKKHNTFDDFICCAEYLIEENYTQEQMISIEGHSAGGMLVGAALNRKPHLFRACLAGVPFVDVLNTMSDASIPLTTEEWLEWGNPHQEKYFEAMKAYCPYYNIQVQPYPAILATAGLFDNRVLYSEPAKWVAKLREHTTDSNRDILLKVDMSSGHSSAGGRYNWLKEEAFQISWLLSELGAIEN